MTLSLTLWPLGLLSMAVNLALLLAPQVENTPFWLRVYNTWLSGWFILTAALIFRFLCRHRNDEHDEHKRELPKPLVVAALILTTASVTGFAYLTGIEIAFLDCDFIAMTAVWYEHALNIVNQWSALAFGPIALYYVMQRKRLSGGYSTIVKQRFVKRALEVTLIMAIVYVTTEKAYDYYSQVCQILAQRYNVSVCVVEPVIYACTMNSLASNKRVWAQLHLEFLRPFLLVFNQELYPILFTLHYVATRPPQRVQTGHTHAVEQKRVVSGRLKSKPISQRLQRNSNLCTVGAVLAIISPLVTISINLQFSQFKYRMRDEKMIFSAATAKTFLDTIQVDTQLLLHGCNQGFTTRIVWFTSGTLYLLRFLVAYYCQSKIIAANDAEERVLHAKEDLVVLLVAMGFKSIQLVTDIGTERGWVVAECLPNASLNAASKCIFGLGMLAESLVLYRMLTLDAEELTHLGFFGPVLSLASLLCNATIFLSHFLKSQYLHHRLHRYPESFDAPSLLMLLIRQLVFPFSFLYNFTAATCWLDLLQKYVLLGAFTLGRKSVKSERKPADAIERNGIADGVPDYAWGCSEHRDGEEPPGYVQSTQNSRRYMVDNHYQCSFAETDV